MGESIDLCRQLGKKGNKMIDFATLTYVNQSLSQPDREGLDCTEKAGFQMLISYGCLLFS